MQVTGTLTYNDIVNATTTDLQWIAANDAASTSLASGAGLAVGPTGAYASFTYNSVANSWQSSLPIIANGGVNANGALSGATTGSFSGNVAADYFIGNGSQLTGLPAGYTNANVAAYLPTYTGNLTAGNVVASGNITANYFIGNGSQLTGIFTSQASFAKYKRTTAQTGIVANSAVICNVSEAFSGSDISVNTTTGSITLQPNKTYRLRGTVGDALRLISGDTCAINFQWFNVTAGALLGTDTYYVSPSSSSNEFYYAGTAEVVFTPTVTTVVQLRITDFSNINSIGNALSSQSFPWIDIEVIGGATPSTGPNPPAFSVYSTASVVIPGTFVSVVVPWNVEEYDSNNWFASNRYTPQLAGWYQISCGARAYSPGNPSAEASVGLRKNGFLVGTSGTIGMVTGTVSRLVFFNGSTDYVDVIITNQVAGTAPQSLAQSYFTGFWVRQ
jgi:hypothetical protein